MSFEIFVFKYKIRAESRLAWLTSENAFGLFRQREPSYLLQTSFMFYFTLYLYQKHFLLHFSFSFYFFSWHFTIRRKTRHWKNRYYHQWGQCSKSWDYLLRFWNKDLPRTPWSSNSLRYSSKIKFRAILDFDAHSSNGGYHKTFLTFNILIYTQF